MHAAHGPVGSACIPRFSTQNEPEFSLQTGLDRAVAFNVRANHHDPTPWNVPTAMNLHSPTPKAGGLRRAFRVTSILLLQPALAQVGAEARMRLPNHPEYTEADTGLSRPYLRVAGALPLHFKSAPAPIPTMATKPSTPPAPPPPVTNDAPSAPKPEITFHEAPTNVPSADPIATPTPPPVYKTVPAIIPDDTRPVARPEDFLPYFRFPASANVSVPTPSGVSQPGPLPASSATYQQR